MVDAAQRTHAALGGRPETADRPTSWAMVHVAGTAALDSYFAHLHHAVAAAPQDELWVRAWAGEASPDHLVASLRIDGVAVFALALEVVSRRGLRVARFIGGSHANANFAPACPNWLEGASAADMRALFHAIAKARPDIDVVMLERQLRRLGRHPNPMLALPDVESPNLALSLDIAAGFEAVLERVNGKKKRKKRRAQQRKFEAAGGYRLIRADTPETVDRLFDAYLEMKQQRFRRMGIADVFADPDVRAALRRIFLDALKDERRPYRLDALEVNGILRAVTGSSTAGDTITCEFAAIREDELFAVSPGDFLTFHNIEMAAAEGFRVYDYGVGDEPYKRSWCDVETRHFDTIVPLTLKGRVAASLLSAGTRAKRAIKSSPLAWRLAKTLRRRMAGSKQEARPVEAPD
jgi:CelD/BcsL family acetyltransferase involved in cellulose biosynthesis